MTELKYYDLTDPIYYQDCEHCKYAYDCTYVGECPIGGPYYDKAGDEDEN